MIWTGAVIGAFVAYHLVQFTFRLSGGIFPTWCWGATR